MNIPSAPVRDTRIDVIRAIALITIFINHVPGNPLEPLTSKNFGFSDAAEAFVLISGVSAALAYGLKFRPGTSLVTTLKMWRRAGVLYMAQLGTTMATLGIFAFFAIHFSAPELLEKINITQVMENTAASLVGLVTFGHQLGYNNILSMYAVVLLVVPGLLLIGRHSLLNMVAVSGLIWLAAGLFRIGPPNFPNEGIWFLNPLSWQFLFVIGLAATMHVKRGGSLPTHPWLIGAAVTYLVVSLAWVQIPLWGINTSMGLPMVLTGFDKTYLSAPRLLHVLSAGYLVAVLPQISALARRSADNPLAVMGRQALPVFVAGTILSMVAQAWRIVHEPTLMGDIAIIAAGVAAQFALAYYIEWYRRLVRNAKAATTAVPAVFGPPPQPVAKPVVARRKPEMA
ncbi:hypothetical protein FY036_22645 [Mesorhizobium microcysteis]|uniref:OpgC domain-containing protein n=1 Tax=Neoaquamicrobium microcysteis TaxID=2682781 RepID=A0A5D4GPG7_9HYPH|nr:OpgC domain-containing protein [Mesorhizobium microcysteis]TYR29649.1 hypothetical protein FY036_22645 [Mesorhizobium microcysteis]